MAITLLSAVLLASGCYYDDEQDLYPNSFCDNTNVTWARSVQPIIQGRCATPGCHVAGGAPGDFTTYAGVKGKVDSGTFNTVVEVNKRMPPSGSLSNCDLGIIAKWLQAGAPQN